MKHTLKSILLIGMGALLVGCKLAVVVVEGGEVQSQGAGTCFSGVVCVVEVTDTNFSETFRASPDADWYFHKWNSGDRFFCGGSPDPECELSLEWAKNNEDIEELVASSEVFFLMPIFKQTPPEVITPNDRPVRVDGKEWLQPIHFVGYSYSQISEVCPNKLCSGTLPGSTTDLTGYFWASSEDVRLLFSVYAGVGRNILEDFIYTLAEKDDELDQIVNLNLRVLLSDETTSEGWVSIGTVYDGQPFEPSKEEVGVGPSPFIYAQSSGSDIGAWFWKAL